MRVSQEYISLIIIQGSSVLIDINDYGVEFGNNDPNERERYGRHLVYLVGVESE
jgi:hypothetical protein